MHLTLSRYSVWRQVYVFPMHFCLSRPKDSSLRSFSVSVVNETEIVNWKEKPHESLSLHLLHCNLNNRTCWTWRELGATQPYCFPFPRGRQEIFCGMYLTCVRTSLPLSLWHNFNHPPSVLRPIPVFIPLGSLLYISNFFVCFLGRLCFCVFDSDIVTVIVCLCLCRILLQGECLFIHTQ